MVRSIFEGRDFGFVGSALVYHHSAKPFDVTNRLEAYWIMFRRKGDGQKEPPSEPLHCDFCSKPSTEVEKLFPGPNGVRICNECVDVCHEIILDFAEHPENDKSAIETDSSYHCSFCTKGRDEVEHLIAGPTVYICNECAGRFREGTELTAAP